MAFKLIRASTLAVVALLSNSQSPNLVQASFQGLGQGVVRIDLERKLINHIDSVQLADTVDVNKFYKIDSMNKSLDNENLLIDMEESNYKVLR